MIKIQILKIIWKNRIDMMKGIHILLFLKKGMICSGKEGHL